MVRDICFDEGIIYRKKKMWYSRSERLFGNLNIMLIGYIRPRATKFN